MKAHTHSMFSNDGEITSLAEEHGVGNLDDYQSVVAGDSGEAELDPADRKAVANLVKQLERSPSFAKASDERRRELAEQLYAKAYQSALLGHSDDDALASLAALRGQSIAELAVELDRERRS